MDKALCLVPKSEMLSGFHYNRDLLKAAMANTYLETVGERADSIHLAIKSVPMSYVYTEYVRSLHVLGPRTGFGSHDAVIAFDHTDEDFYGELEDTWLHSWTGEHGVTGKFRFLTCSLVSGDMPQRIPPGSNARSLRSLAPTLPLELPSQSTHLICTDLVGCSSEQALWELEKLQVAELIIKGDEIHAARKLTRMGNATASIIHLFSFGGETAFPGIEGGI